MTEPTLRRNLLLNRPGIRSITSAFELARSTRTLPLLSAFPAEILLQIFMHIDDRNSLKSFYSTSHLFYGIWRSNTYHILVALMENGGRVPLKSFVMLHGRSIELRSLPMVV